MVLLEVARLSFETGHWVVNAGYAVSETLRPLGFVWDVKAGLWKSPRAPSVTALAQLNAIGVHVPEAPLKEVVAQHSREHELIALQSSTDVQVACGDGIDPYQRVGVKFLTTAKRALLADAPGIGKSAQAVRAACAVDAKKVLVVTKKSLIYNWQHQVKLWSVGERCYEVTNYEQIVCRPEKYFTQPYDVLIVDEATAVKNRKSKRTKELYRLARKIPYVWLLTGTPILNRPDELWSLLHIIDHKRFSSYWRFVEQYCATEYNVWSGRERPVGIKPGVDQILASDLSTVMLRRDRSVIYLPPLTEETIYIRLEGKQASQYHDMEQNFFIYWEDLGEVCHAPSVVAQLVRLQQLVCSPVLLGGPEQSVKTDVLLDVVAEYAEDHKLLVFTTFARYAQLLYQRLQQHEPAIITGSVSAKNRQLAVDRFNVDPKCRVLLGTYGAIGEGMNIQTADIVVHANKPWVPAMLDQAVSRAHRRGQEKPVHVISLCAVGTVDNDIEETLASKKEVINQFDIIARMVAERGKGVVVGDREKGLSGA